MNWKPLARIWLTPTSTRTQGTFQRAKSAVNSSQQQGYRGNVTAVTRATLGQASQEALLDANTPAFAELPVLGVLPAWSTSTAMVAPE
jgi:hypothetical protein